VKQAKLIARLLAATMLALSLDALSKAWAERALLLGEPVPVIGEVVRLTLSYNTGVAFSLFADRGITAIVLSGIIICGLVLWLMRSIWRGNITQRALWLFGFILGGALGNFVDRVGDGRVTDFLDVGIEAARWPTFNIADVCLMVALALLLLVSFRGEPLPAASALRRERDVS
jgi:signal peptidase II